MAAAAETAPPRVACCAMVGFTYRRVPAATFARDLVAAGRIGEIRQVRAELPAGLARSTPTAPLTWRLQKDRARARARSATSAPTPSTSPSTSPACACTSVSGIIETIVSRASAARESTSGLSRHRRSPSAATSPSTTSPCSPGATTPGVARHVRGHALRHRPQERAARRGLRLAGRARVRPRGPQRAAVLRRDRSRRPSRASARSW